MVVLKFIMLVVLILVGGFLGEIVGRMITGDKSVGNENNDTTNICRYFGMGLTTLIGWGLLLGN